MQANSKIISKIAVVFFLGSMLTGIMGVRNALSDDKAPDAKSQTQVERQVDKNTAQDSQPASKVTINGLTLTQSQIQEFELLYGVTPVPGNYWYDAMSGLYGLKGQQPSGMMLPGHTFGKLASNASNGDSGVFFNGRELTSVEVNYINLLLGIETQKGRYWLDAYGNCGVEGIALPLVNFYAAAQARGGSGGGDNFWSSNFGAGNYDADNSRGYVSVPGHGPIGYGF